jgi:hypothetical protein
MLRDVYIYRAHVTYCTIFPLFIYPPIYVRVSFFSLNFPTSPDLECIGARHLFAHILLDKTPKKPSPKTPQKNSRKFSKNYKPKNKTFNPKTLSPNLLSDNAVQSTEVLNPTLKHSSETRHLNPRNSTYCPQELGRCDCLPGWSGPHCAHSALPACHMVRSSCYRSFR